MLKKILPFTITIFFLMTLIVNAEPIKTIPSLKKLPSTSEKTIKAKDISLKIILPNKAGAFYFQDKATSLKITKRVWFFCYEGYKDNLKNNPVYMYDYKKKETIKVGTYTSVFASEMSSDLVKKIKSNQGNTNHISFDIAKHYKLSSTRFRFVAAVMCFDKDGREVNAAIVKFTTLENPFYDKNGLAKNRNSVNWEYVPLKFEKKSNI